jgi:hypothetical protein
VRAYPNMRRGTLAGAVIVGVTTAVIAATGESCVGDNGAGVDRDRRRNRENAEGKSQRHRKLPGNHEYVLLR